MAYFKYITMYKQRKLWEMKDLGTVGCLEVVSGKASAAVTVKVYTDYTASEASIERRALIVQSTSDGIYE